MSPPLIKETANQAARAQPDCFLSVLIPFFRDDARALLASLSAQAPEGVEIILFDDGMPDPELTAAMQAAVLEAPSPARLLVSRINAGRSGARNRLAARARGGWLLFLDADMHVSPDFLDRWTGILRQAGEDAVFGGYEPCQQDRRFAVHAALARVSDVRSAAQRAHAGPVAVCSSNLAVRAGFFREVPFDEGYQGWGWEDVDWALNAAARGRIGHADNPAAHGGLQPVEILLAKFAASGPNFARLLQRHPQYAAQPGARLALALKRLRLGACARLAGRLGAKAPFLPAAIRARALKLFRAGAAAGALP